MPRALWQRTAVRHLKRADPVLANIIERVGPSRFARPTTGSHLDALVRSIVSQQLSTSAAATIYSRLIALVGVAEPLPHHWLALNDPDLRAAGLSRQKISYIRDLARHVQEDLLPMAKLHEMEDDAVIEALTQVKGIGVWTAQMFLMFRLGRPDILPVLDLGLQSLDHIFHLVHLLGLLRAGLTSSQRIASSFHSNSVARVLHNDGRQRGSTLADARG